LDSPRVTRRTKPRSARNPEGAALAQHRARCRVCRHAQLEEIERQFLEWENPREIAAQWKFASYRSIYRHARAFGLFRKRLGHIELALDRIIERVGGVNITAASVIAAIRLRLEIEISNQDIHLQALRGELPAKYFAIAAAAAATKSDAEENRAGREENDKAKRDTETRPTMATSPAQSASVPVESPHCPPRPGSEVRREPESPATQTEARPEMIREPKPKPASDPKPPEQKISEVGIRKEPDGPPMLAGKTLPWPPGKIHFARRPRWRPIGQG
jgi:hypothetical protein